MYSFTNKFGGAGLYQRIAMINGRSSGYTSWWRYMTWAILIGIMVLACRHKHDSVDQSRPVSSLPPTNASRVLVNTLKAQGSWRTDMFMIRDRFSTKTLSVNPVVLQIKENHLFVADESKYTTDVYINSKPASIEILEKLSAEFVEELFVLHKWEDAKDTDPMMKPYQVIVQISPNVVATDKKRDDFFTFLQAAAISQHPLGETHSFTMNQLLEATFFHNKNALVERTKNEHLKVYDDIKNSISVFINDLPATVNDVSTIHVREVAWLHTKERPYTAWFHSSSPGPRFELHIRTEPKRANRDSTYYVFSPFYSGDF